MLRIMVTDDSRAQKLLLNDSVMYLYVYMHAPSHILASLDINDRMFQQTTSFNSQFPV